MRVLVISGYGIKLSYRKGVLVVKSNSKSAKYSLSDVDRVVVTTSGVSITSKVIRALTTSGIELVIMDSKGFPVALLYHPYVSRTVATRRGQYLAFNDGRGIEVVKVVATSKMLNQAGLLKRFSRLLGIELSEDISTIRDYVSKVLELSSNDLLSVRREVINYEALAARVYWGAIASILPRELEFNGRDQGGNDVVNKALNYCYGILYSECWKALALAGLDPYAGFLHSDRSGKPVLVFDVVEVFRSAVVDYHLIKALIKGWVPKIEGGLISHESRVELIKLINDGLNTKFKVGNNVKTLKSWITTFSNALAKYLRGEGIIKPLVFRW